MLILGQKDIQNWDKYTIADQNIPSILLMKRAASRFTTYVIKLFPDTDIPFTIICGCGNNGGDGIAVAINLRDAFYEVNVIICDISNPSPDWQIMYDELVLHKEIKITTIKNGDDLNSLKIDGVIIDALFGTGLSRPVENYWGDLIDFINAQDNKLISIDTPSGLFTEKTPQNESIIQADFTGTFQCPKLSQLIPESEKYVGKLSIIDIGLSESFIPEQNFRHFVEYKDIISIVAPRKKHQHKGDFGHAMMMCGSKGMAGALILSAKACLRSGVGKLTVLIPDSIDHIVQTAIPEAMSISYLSDKIDYDSLDLFDCIAIGCGLGTHSESVKQLDRILNKIENVQIIIDADGLNIIAQNKWQSRLPENTVITPHVKEFDRLFGVSKNTIERFESARKQAMKFNIFIVLKGAHTCISTPSGIQYFNSTGNPGMATAGSGDVLTGILCGLLSQNYSILDACILGVYLHGLSGDLAKASIGEHAIIASDIINNISNAYLQLEV